VVLSLISAKYSDIITLKSEVFQPPGLWYNISKGLRGLISTRRVYHGRGKGDRDQARDKGNREQL
jgi:hypothetical protein